MLIVNNPSGNGIDIIEGGRRLSIKPRQSGQVLPVEGEQAKVLQGRLSKGYPYLTFGAAEGEAAAEQAAPEAVAEAEADEQAAPEAAEQATEAKARPQHNTKRGR